ncbi:MAG: hypothetical protein DIZ80_06475 [endosymbiont of Galathealinum brachiosum]|uniref:Glycosyltransferase 2-like domain-containing protein n=1 Tax=endosymbiont of Galathealinum brachiosum TaxID=2200906 RepID=A0A370DFT7_9GAMM|nr:MAG: hypothetical protein DIZ80_06475 [endosymbiont of Galathealinum brachiosum]
MSILEKKPLVSIIIPAYNSEEFIGRALDSVFSQTYNNYEIIVIDDGSIDETSNIVRSYEQNIVYLYQENAGVSAARNAGISIATGELIALLDSDDLWYPDKLEIQVNAYLNNPEVSLIHTGIDKSPDFKGYVPIVNDDLIPVIKEFEAVFKDSNLKTSSIMIPKKVLDDVGLFNVELPTAEDRDLFLRCSYNKLVIFIPQILVFYPIFNGSLSDELRSYQDNIDVIDAFIKCHPEFLLNNKTLVNNAKSLIYYEYADDLCFKNHCFESISAAIKSIRYKFNTASILIGAKAFFKILLLSCKNK